MKPVKVFYTTALSFDGFHSAFKSSHKGKGWSGFPVYFACVNVNAKNTYGGYTGWQTFKVMHGTQLVHLVQAIPARMPLRVKIFMLSIVPLMS